MHLNVRNLRNGERLALGFVVLSMRCEFQAQYYCLETTLRDSPNMRNRPLSSIQCYMRKCLHHGVKRFKFFYFTISSYSTRNIQRVEAASALTKRALKMCMSAYARRAFILCAILLDFKSVHMVILPFEMFLCVRVHCAVCHDVNELINDVVSKAKEIFID